MREESIFDAYLR